MKKKLFVLTLAFLITFALMPTIAFGTTGVPYVDDKGVQQTPVDTKDVVSDITIWDINDGNWYSVSGTVPISARIVVTGDVNLILTDGARLEASAGIQVASGNSLTIYSQSEGTGTLIATGVDSTGDAGIGGNYGTPDGENSGTVNIYGGTIEATGGGSSGGGGAGLGGGGSDVYGGDGGTVNIYGGTVEATGGVGSDNGAGIGGGGGSVGGGASANGEIEGDTVVIASSIPLLGQSGFINPAQGIIFLPDSGVVSGIVYGDTALPEDLTLNSGQTLTVPLGTSLTIPEGVTLTNDNTTTPIDNQGTIRVAGILAGSGTIGGSGDVLYQLRLIAGQITATPIPLGQFYSQGDSVNILADSPSEMIFSNWSAIVNGANANPPVSSTTSATSTVTMPAGAVVLTANFLDNPTLRVIYGFTTFDGTGSRSASISEDRSNYIKLTLNGENVDKSNIDVTSGSTIITLNESYLKTFSDGSYTFVAHFTNGRTVNLPITIAANNAENPDTDDDAENPKTDDDAGNSKTGNTSGTPNTADDTPLGLMFALIVVAGATLIVRRRFAKN